MNLTRREVLRVGIGGLSLLAVGDGVSFAGENHGEKQESVAGDSALGASARVATVAMNSVMGNPQVNLDRIEQWCRKAHAAGASFAVFPEYCVTGALHHDFDFLAGRPIVKKAEELALAYLEKICRELQMTVVVGTIERCGSRFSNSALIVGPSGYLATYSKLHLSNASEKAWFEPGKHLVVISSQGWTFGVGICFDVRIPEMFRASAQQGAQFFLLSVGGNGPNPCGLKECRDMKRGAMLLLPSRAIDNALYLFHANAAGQSGSNFFPGVALSLDPAGKLIGEHLTEGMLVSEMSRDVWKACRKDNNCTIDVIRPDVYQNPLIVSGVNHTG